MKDIEEGFNGAAVTCIARSQYGVTNQMYEEAIETLRLLQLDHILAAENSGRFIQFYDSLGKEVTCSISTYPGFQNDRMDASSS